IGEVDGIDEKLCKNDGTDELVKERSESDVLRVRKRGFQDENNPGILLIVLF
ncbi:hypothetical protein LOAG_12474, partial [Loa loa]